MELLWVVGPLAVTVGVVLALAGLRRTVAETDELLHSLRRFHEVSGALDGVRQAADDSVGHLRRLRGR